MLNKKILDLQAIKELQLEILAKMSDLAIAGFGLVAALSWNGAIQAVFNKFLPKDGNSGVIALIVYAVVITVIVVLITLHLSRMVNKAKAELTKIKEEKTGKTEEVK
jgi:hypothetical protein